MPPSPDDLSGQSSDRHRGVRRVLLVRGRATRRRSGAGDRPAGTWNWPGTDARRNFDLVHRRAREQGRGRGGVRRGAHAGASRRDVRRRPLPRRPLSRSRSTRLPAARAQRHGRHGDRRDGDRSARRRRAGGRLLPGRGPQQRCQQPLRAEPLAPSRACWPMSASAASCAFDPWHTNATWGARARLPGPPSHRGLIDRLAPHAAAGAQRADGLPRLRLTVVQILVVDRAAAAVLDWSHQRKEVVQHMSESSFGTLEVVGR